MSHITKALEEATQKHLPTMPEAKKEEKKRRTANGIVLYFFALAALFLAIFVIIAGKGGVVAISASVVFMLAAFWMTTVAGHNISGEMAEAIEKSGNPASKILLKFVAAKLGRAAEAITPKDDNNNDMPPGGGKAIDG